MSIGSLVGGAVITGVVFYVIGFFFWAYSGKKLFFKFWFRKQIPKAKLFLIELDHQYLRDTTEKKIREQRERAIANSGFNKHIIEYADKLNQKERIKNGAREKEHTTEPNGNAPTPDGTDDGSARGTNDATDSRGIGNGNAETERRRILPPSENPTDDGTEQPSEWDWSSFSKTR